MCKGEFESGWTDEEAKEELKENFDGESTDDCDVVCDDCYKAVTIGGKPIIFN